MTTRWRIPSSAIAVAAFFALVALPRPAISLIDGDVFWHIRAGEEILDSGSVSRVDTWSIVGKGMEWTSQDWLSNVCWQWLRMGEIGPRAVAAGALWWS